jgi:hypothetical protein
MARLIHTDGTEEVVHPKGKKWSLEELQAHVGGLIEYMPGIGRTRMILDEEGRLKGKEVNEKATMIVHNILLGKDLRYVPVLVGDVLLLEPGEKT